MAHTLKRRAFPKHIFEQLSKNDCQSFIEAIHYTTEAETTSDVKDALLQFQNLFPFSRVIGGLARLNAKGAFDGFTNVINVSYPEEWIRLYWQNGYFEVDPRNIGRQRIRRPALTLKNNASLSKQQESLDWLMELQRDLPIPCAEWQRSARLPQTTR